jgi:hypothetical protein
MPGFFFSSSNVMAGLDPAIHISASPAVGWMAGSEAGHDK